MTQPEELNQIAEFAWKYVSTTKRHIFLTGKAGTGKTTFLRNIARFTHKNTVIAAPTGIAAINAGGVTLHSLLQLPFGAFLPEDNPQLEGDITTQLNTPKSMMANLQMNGRKREMIRAIELLIIDEVSMLRADLLDAIDTVLRKIRRKDSPFGGVQMLFIGDLLQLPPVVKDDEWPYLKKYYASQYFFAARVISEVQMVYLELNKIYRQSDPTFIRLLNKLRDNRISKEDIDLLNRYYNPDFRPQSGKPYINLTTHNYKADRINSSELAELKGKTYEYRAEVDGEFQPNNYPVEEILKLKKHAQVMFIKNDPSGQGGFFNGKLGTVSELDLNSIAVRFSDGSPDVTVEPYVWENKRFKLNAENIIEEEIIGTFKHYPIKLAWAITIHKSQGLTFERAILDVSGAFAPGQVYVALSRLTGLGGLVLSAPFGAQSFNPDTAVTDFVQDKQLEADAIMSDLRMAASEYLGSYVTEAFDLSHFEWQLSNHAMTYDKDELISAKQKFASWANDLAQQGSETKAVADKFVAQLRKITAQRPIDFELLTARLNAALHYFDPLFAQYRRKFELHLGAVAAVKGTKAYQTELKELASVCASAQQGMYKSLAMVEAVSADKEFTRESIKKLSLAPQLKPVIPMAIKKPKPPKNPKLHSSLLFLAGETIDQIALKQDIKVSTVQDHLTWGIRQGLVPIHKLMPLADVNEIIACSEKLGTELLLPIKEAFGEKYDYRALRMVMAHKHLLNN